MATFSVRSCSLSCARFGTLELEARGDSEVVIVHALVRNRRTHRARRHDEREDVLVYTQTMRVAALS